MKDVIQKKLETYHLLSAEAEENALKEISQEVVLYALNQSGFFEYAVFQGGTCLRIVHQLDRFSEDLDFALKKANLGFDLSPYFEKISEVMKIFGYEIEIVGVDNADSNIRSRFLKDDSIKKFLDFKHTQDVRKKIQIKLEVDLNPPDGAENEANYLDFPTDFMVMTHDLPSLMAGKFHALLCRSYVKGRDWYDFLWYVKNNIKVNKKMLERALKQQGPWKGLTEEISGEWLLEKLESKIKTIDWEIAKRDVDRFLRSEKKETLKLWSEDFFLKKAKQAFDKGLL